MIHSNILQKKEYKTNSSHIQKKQPSFFSPLTFQKKLTIGSENDAYEVEADRVAYQTPRRNGTRGRRDFGAWHCGLDPKGKP